MKIGSTQITSIKIGSIPITKVYKGDVINWGQIPNSGDALFWLDGTILLSGSDYYFVDQTANARNFLITGYDFNDDWTVGFPYKSAATISAPAGDAVLIAADINNYLYDSGGTPNTIPVISLFQDVDYENKLFCRHAAQVVDGNGVETYKPRVLDMVLYNTVKSGADLVTCQSYYEVPVENTSTSVWLSPLGNDTTGTGDKATPYRSILKIQATTKTIVYLKTGDYSITDAVGMTGNSLIMQGVGLTTFTTRAAVSGLTVNRDVKFKHCVITGTGSSYAMMCNNNIELESCKIIYTGCTFVINQAGAEDNYIRFTSSIFYKTGTAYVASIYVDNAEYSIAGCFGIFADTRGAGKVATLQNITNSKLTGNIANYGGTITVKGSDVTGTIAAGVVSYSTVSGTVGGTSVDYCTIGGATIVTTANQSTITGKLTATTVTYCTVNGECVSNTIHNSTITGDVTGSPLEIQDNIINGNIIVALVNNQQIKDNTVISSGQPLSAKIAAASNKTGVVVSGNSFTGTKTSGYLVYVGGVNEGDDNAVNGLQFINNKIINTTSVSGSAHSVFLGGGIDFKIKYNYINASVNGYGIVIKAGGGHYTTTDGHISYNIIHCMGTVSNAIYGRGVYGIIVSNNVITNCSGNEAFKTDDNGVAQDNSMLCVNNIVSLAGNLANLSVGTNMTSRNNSINKNGFTCTVGANDDVVSTVINELTGVPSTRENDGEEIAGDNNIGLGVGYSIPNAIIYNTQDAIWQRGSVILD